MFYPGERVVMLLSETAILNGVLAIALLLSAAIGYGIGRFHQFMRDRPRQVRPQ